MPLFTITAWCDRAYYTRLDIEAETPEQALEAAKEQVNDNDAEECDSYYLWDTSRVEDQDEKRLLFWQDEGVRLQSAASKLLAALEAGRSKSWVHNAAITQDIEALRRIALEQCGWWNNTALPLIEKLKDAE